jgi:hypothetical protein
MIIGPLQGVRMRPYVLLLVKEERDELLNICRSTTIMGPLLLIREQNEHGSVDKGESTKEKRKIHDEERSALYITSLYISHKL